MAETPTISRYNDPAQYVILPGFESRSGALQRNSTLLTFEGDDRPRAASGQGGTRQWRVDGVFWRTDYALAFQLESLLQAAAAASDSRLEFTVGGRMDLIITRPLVVECMSWDISFQRGTGIYECSMTLDEVAS